MAQQNKKITELPLVEAADGLLTLGVNSQNESVQIPLGDLLGKINDTTSTLATAIDEEEEGRRQADSKLRESINTEIAGRKAADLTKKNNDYVVSVDIVSGYVPMSDGNSYLLLDVDWETLADVIRNGNCDIVVADTHFNYKLEHVWVTEDGMPYGNKLLSNNRIIRVQTFEDTNGYLRVVYDSIESDALRKTPQVLSESEKQTARANIGAQGQLTTSADLALRDDVLSLTDMAKKRLFIDLWNECAVDFGRYNEETGYFELNGITDLTWDDALFIYTISANKDAPLFANVGFGYSANTHPGRFRTNLPINYGQRPYSNRSANASYGLTTYLCSGLEVLNVFAKMPFGRKDSFCPCTGLDFYYNHSLRKIDGLIWLNMTGAINHGYDLPKLEEINLYNITQNYKYLYKAPKLNYTSVKTMIEKRGGTNAITIWYHADVYNKILGTADDAAYASSGGTKEEWMALADLAASKNITLATE